MKIAVASEGPMVSEHFGHCDSFLIFDTDSKQILRSEVIPNPGHRPGFLPNFLNDLGIKVIIAGGMGAGAIEIFTEKNIKIFTGVKGDAKIAVEQYLQGQLQSAGFVCHEHQHHGECGRH
ncbi:MAG: dinitrogenase iron-molybdenum cofactor [Peptococcaceae bacterium]|nr:dinitrogenase iron-molybdenum cofactor [Peptococcaceae bacterium]